MLNIHRSIFVLILLLLNFHSGTLNAQNEPDSQVVQTLAFLDNIPFEAYKNATAENKNRIDFGLRVCRQYIREKPDSLARSMFYYHRGRMESMKEQYDTAFACYTEALNLNVSNYPALVDFSALTTEHFPAFNNLWAYINASINVWKTKCSLDSTIAFQWYYLAKTYELQTRYTKVINQFQIGECYQKCITLEPENPHYYYAYAQQVPCREKTVLLKKALQLEEMPIYRVELMACYLQQKKFTDLHKLADESIGMYGNPNSADYQSLSFVLWL